MEFTQLSARDAEKIKRLFVSVFTREPWKDDWSDEKQLDQYILDLVGNPNSLTLAYAEGEELIALAMGHIRHWYRGTEYYIDELCVKTEAQSRGVGGRFLSQIEKYLAAHGVRAIFLLTDHDAPAYSFYLHNGFSPQELAALAKTIEPA